MHSEASYDASLTLVDIAAGAARFGFRKMGVTDHVNFNDRKFMVDLEKSAGSVNKYKAKFPNIVSGVPVTFGSDSHFEYVGYHLKVEDYLVAAGFKDGEISELDERVLW